MEWRDDMTEEECREYQEECRRHYREECLYNAVVTFLAPKLDVGRFMRMRSYQRIGRGDLIDKLVRSGYCD